MANPARCCLEVDAIVETDKYSTVRKKEEDARSKSEFKNAKMHQQLH